MCVLINEDKSDEQAVQLLIAWYIATCFKIHRNLQNLLLKIFAKFYKRLVSKVSCLVSVSSRLFAKSFGLVSVSKILAETPALLNTYVDYALFCS